MAGNGDPIFGLIVLIIIGFFVYLHFKRMTIGEFVNSLRGK